MVYLFLADGFEEIEALYTLDLLRRANIDVKTVGVGGIYVTGSHNITVKADLLIDELDVSDCEGVILPGGMPGTTNLYDCEKVIELVRKCADEKKLVCAICAAPLILGRLGLLEGKRAVCFPGFEAHLAGATLPDDGARVVCDGKVITAKGMGVALEFGLALVRALKGDAVAEQIRTSVFAN